MTPKPGEGYEIDLETLEHLPREHKLIALTCIADGRWRLVDRVEEDRQKQKTI